MKKLLFVLMLLSVYSTQASAVTAIWTGRSEKVQTITYKWKWKCQYQYLGKYYWFLFDEFCPSTVELE